MGIGYNPFTGQLDLKGAGGTQYMKSPVANAASLPLVGNSDGDARVTLDTDKIWVWDDTGSRWTDSGLSASGVVGSSPNTQGYTINLDETVANLRTRELILQPADGSNPGIISTSSQNIAGNKTFDNDVIVTGDLTVNGTTTTINTATLDVTDANITVNNGGNQATANTNVAGLTVEMSDATDVRIGYDSTLTSRFKVGDLASEAEIVTVSHSQTLINKTIDADNNTISNLAHGAEVDNPSSGVHGVTGNVVGTSDTQTLTNKTIDGDDNTLQDIAITSLKTELADADKFIERDATGAVISGKAVPTGAVVGTSDTQSLTNKTIDADLNTISNLAHGAEVDDPSSGVHGVTGNIIGTSDTQTLTNKTIDADLNTISNIDNADIKAGAAIDAAKLHDGSVSNTEFGYLDGVTSSIQTQLDNKPEKSAGDLNETSFSLANNQAAPANVTGLAFANGTVRSARVNYSVIIDATADLFETGVLELVQRGANWSLAQSSSGDDSLVDFTVTTAGQLQYTSSNYAGFVSGTMKFRALTTSV